MRKMRVIRVGFMLLLSMLVLPAATVAQGNSEAAHACQGGGYLNYTDADGNSFKNAGHCTRYAAQNGELVHKATPMIYLDQEAGSISGTGFAHNTQVINTRVYAPSGTVVTDSLFSTDENGAFDSSGYYFCSADKDTSVTVTVTAGVTVTETFSLSCG